MSRVISSVNCQLVARNGTGSSVSGSDASRRSKIGYSDTWSPPDAPLCGSNVVGSAAVA